jgi:hypothetical protein
MDNAQQLTEIRAYSKGELKALYNISYYTLKNWIKPFNEEIGPILGGMFTPMQIKKIFSKLGNPTE